MRVRKENLSTDLAIVFLLTLIFVALIFFSIYPQDIVTNSIMLGATVAVLIITYFTTLISGLIMDTVLLVLFVLYTAYKSWTVGATPPPNTYFWVFWVPLTTVALSVFAENTNKAQEENAKLSQRLDKLATIDENTKLKNLRAYMNDFGIYTNISKRYNLDLALIVWELGSQEQIRRQLGNKTMRRLVRRISRTIEDSLRGEDAVYLLGDNPYLWGTLVLMNTASAEVVLNRASAAIHYIDITDLTNQNITILLRAGVLSYEKDEEGVTPLAFLDRVKMQINTEMGEKR